MSGELPEIVWQPASWGVGERGFLGRVPIWRASYHNAGRCYLACALPDIKSSVECPDLDAAKARAVKQLAAFFKAIGVSPAPIPVNEHEEKT